MPACFLTKMAAIGKDDGSEIERNKTEKKTEQKNKTKTEGLYKWRYCLPNSSTAYTIPLNIIYTYLINPLGFDWSEFFLSASSDLVCTTNVKRKLDCIII